MDWLFDNFKFVLLIGVVVISLAKRYLDSKREAGGGETESPFEDWTPPATPPPRRPPPLVRTTLPPPPPPPASQLPPRAPQRSALPPPPLSAAMTEAASVMQRQQDMMDRLQNAKEAKAQRAKLAGSSHRSSRKPGKTAEASLVGGLHGILRNRNEIRRAVILREVLDPPLGMR